MKRNLLRTMLLAAAFTAGAGVANATEYTEEYDFSTFMTNAGSNIEISVGNNAITRTDGDVYVMSNPTSGSTTLDLKGRIALWPIQTTTYNQRWLLRSSTSKKYQNGLSSQYIGKGTTNNLLLSILNLYNGDKVTITYSVNSTSANIKFLTASSASLDGTAVNSAATMTSGSEYTISASDDNTMVNLDLYSENNNLAIQEIKIVTTHGTETVDAPKIEVTGASGGDRTVTITADTETSASNETTTYYTTDGTDPMTSSTKYTEPFTVTSSQATDGTVTVKALTVKSDDATIASDITTLSVEGVGTTLTLSSPAYSITAMTETSGVYYPTYSFTSDNSSIIGTPTATLSATLDGTAVENFSGTYTFTGAGTLVVTASADGYTSSETTVNGQGYVITKTSNDFSSATQETITTVLGDGWTVNETSTRWAYWSRTAGKNLDGTSNNGASYYVARSDNNPATVDFLSFSNSKKALYLFGYGIGSSESNTTVSVSNPIKGSIVDYSIYYQGNTQSDVFVDYATSSTLSYSIPKNSTVVSCATLYAPASSVEQVSVTSAGLATYASDNILDFTNATDIYAYTATVSDDVVTLKKATVVPSGQGVLLRAISGGEASEYIPVLQSTEVTISDNAFVRGTGATVASTDGSNTNYILNNGDSGLGFYLANDQTVATDKAYLQVSGTSGAKTLSIVFDGETTGIKAIDAAGTAQDNQVYNLQGQRISQPTKGLYIVNGKKVIMK